MKRKYDKTPFSDGICSYRMKMVDFITGDGGGGGVIGRVFRNNRVECTPNIGYYSYEEYSDRDLALSCHIKSSLAFPLSDSSGCLVGVVEILSSVEWKLDAENIFRYVFKNYLGYRDCCKDIYKQESGSFSLQNYLGFWDCFKDVYKQYDSLKMAVSEIEEVMLLVGRSCCLVCAQTWMLCNGCSRLSTSEGLVDNLGGFFMKEYNECRIWSNVSILKKGEGVVGKAATSSHNLVYCDDVSQFSITEYPLAHFARHRKLTACFATCLRSNHTGNLIYVLEFFLHLSKVNGRGPRAMLVPILEGMRQNFETFKLASGEEIGDNLSVQVIEAGTPDKFEILEIGKLDSVENNTFEMDWIHNYVNVVNTIEEGVAIASSDKQHNSFEISAGNRGGELAVDCLAIDNGENMGSNVGEQPVTIASWENQHNNATISSIGSINLSVGGAAKMLNGELPPRNGIDISFEEVSVSVSTFNRVRRDYQISSGPRKNYSQTGSTKEFGGSASTVQSESLVTIKAKYEDNFIKFKLSTSSGINAFNQQVSKRLKLETGSYVAKYQDDDNDWILVACDDDLRDYISSSVSLGKTTLIMLLEHI